MLSIAFSVYLLLIIVVGFFAAKQTKDLKDFALGGQKLGPWVIAFSERASGESAWLILGLPGAALMAGLFEIWTVVGSILGIIFSWLVIAKPLREMTEKYQAITLPELFDKRFNDEKGTIRLLSGFIITFFFVFYVAAQFSGAGKVLNVTFGLTHIEGMMLGAVIIVLYTLMGGFLAVAWTDLIQGIIMICTLTILPFVALMTLNDFTEYKLWNIESLYGGKTGISALIGIMGGLSWGFGYMGQPHLVTRFMAIDSPENIQTSRKIAFAWAVPAFFGAMLIGLAGNGLIEAGVLSHNGNIITSIHQLPDPEKLMPIMATSLLPAWLSGIFISGAIAAMMSTADSQLLVSTSVLTEDLLMAKSNTFMGKSKLTWSRIFTIIIGLFAFWMAWQSKDLVFELVSYAWSGLGASFGPALLLTLWWKRIQKEGVIAGLLVGSFSTIIWANIHGLTLLMTERIVSFVLALVSVIIVSIYFEKKNGG